MTLKEYFEKCKHIGENSTVLTVDYMEGVGA